MNKIIVAAWIAIALVSFVSCGSDKKQQAPPPVKQEEKPLSPEEQMKADVSQKMKAELGSSKKMLNIIAGFSFGMNADQVERHTMKMTGRKALRKVKKGKNKVEYVYQLPVKSAKMKTDTYLDIEFQDGGLYKAVCKAKAPKGAGNGDFLREVKSLFIEWYGKITFQLPEYNSCERYLWIEGNRHIDLRCEVDGVTIVYTDLTSEQPALDITGTQLEIKDVNNK